MMISALQRQPSAPHRRQRGAILVIALLFLVLLTMLALTSMSGTTLEERMAGQYRDLNLAFQAAEAGLRDAERDLLGQAHAGFTAIRNPGVSGGTGSGDNAATAGTCSQDGKAESGGRGLCRPIDSGATPRLLTHAPFTINLNPPTASVPSPDSVPYGQFTGATALAGVASPPRYIIEALCQGLPPRAGQSLGAAPTCYHRLTSRGFGANPGTAGIPQTPVTLQEVYLVPTL